MNDNDKKPKENKKLPEAYAELEDMPNPNDLQELLKWMQSPRVSWQNFGVTIPIKNPNDIKWFSLRIAEA